MDFLLLVLNLFVSVAGPLPEIALCAPKVNEPGKTDRRASAPPAGGSV